MNDNGERSLELAEENIGFIKRNLADFLTLSRVIIGLIILSLSFIGQGAYLAVVVLTLVGGATDMLDGRAARHFLGDSQEGRLGKHDAEVDAFFMLCVVGYMSLTEVVIPRVVGLVWIGLVIAVTLLTRRNLKVIIVAEISTVISLLVITLLYNPLVFGIVIVPVMAVGLFINRRRVLYLIFSYWPDLFWKR